jgi:hypothetical protein
MEKYSKDKLRIEELERFEKLIEGHRKLLTAIGEL